MFAMVGGRQPARILCNHQLETVIGLRRPFVKISLAPASGLELVFVPKGEAAANTNANANASNSASANTSAGVDGAGFLPPA